MSALLWVGTWSFLESPQKLFPTLISKRLLGDFLWSGKLYRYIHRTSSNNFGVVRVNGSNIRNYMVWLLMYPFLVICRSSLFSLQIKKEFLKTSQLSLLYLRCYYHCYTRWRWPPGSTTAPGWLTEPSWLSRAAKGQVLTPLCLASRVRSLSVCISIRKRAWDVPPCWSSITPAKLSTTRRAWHVPRAWWASAAQVPWWEPRACHLWRIRSDDPVY